jgi:hypothetical protein
VSSIFAMPQVIMLARTSSFQDVPRKALGVPIHGTSTPPIILLPRLSSHSTKPTAQQRNFASQLGLPPGFGILVQTYTGHLHLGFSGPAGGAPGPATVHKWYGWHCFLQKASNSWRCQAPKKGINLAKKALTRPGCAHMALVGSE